MSNVTKEDAWNLVTEICDALPAEDVVAVIKGFENLVKKSEDAPYSAPYSTGGRIAYYQVLFQSDAVINAFYNWTEKQHHARTVRDFAVWLDSEFHREDWND